MPKDMGTSVKDITWLGIRSVILREIAACVKLLKKKLLQDYKDLKKIQGI